MKQLTDLKHSRISQLINLFNCAMVDGHLAESEKSLLIEIAARLNIKSINIKTFINSSNNPRFQLPVKLEERMQHMIDLVFMMMIDCQISNSELKFCKAIAKRIGFKPTAVEMIISNILKDINSEISQKKIPIMYVN